MGKHCLVPPFACHIKKRVVEKLHWVYPLVLNTKKRVAGEYYWVLPIFLRLLLYFPVLCLFKIFCKFEVRGIENIRINKTHGVIFAANHASELDPVLVSIAMPFIGEHNPLFFAADEPKMFASTETFGWRSYIYKGWFFRAWGAYPVYLKQPRFRDSLRHHVKLLQNNKSILYFPEGERTKDGNPKNAKPGIGYLLYKTDTIVIPVGIKGSFGMSVKNFLLGRIRACVSFGPPIRAKDMWGDKVKIRVCDFKEGADGIMLQVKELLY